MNLLAMLRNFVAAAVEPRRLWVAYSGGLDSHVLLTLCQQLRHEIPVELYAIHINHGISPHAAAWAAHCARVCQAYGINYVEHCLQLSLQPGDSVEEIARDARQTFFSKCLQPGDWLLTAHHQDDQAETLLLQLMRGAGLKGLAAMPAAKPLGQGWQGRPLLAAPRQVLQQYAVAQGLQWVEDESNCNTQLTRNFIRQTILPLLKERWPTVTATIARSAMHCAESQALLEEFMLSGLNNLQGTCAETLSVTKLNALPAAQQRLALRTWVLHQGLRLPDANRLAAIQRDVLTAKPDRMPCVTWLGGEVRRYRDDLYALPSPSLRGASFETVASQPPQDERRRSNPGFIAQEEWHPFSLAFFRRLYALILRNRCIQF